MKTIALCFNIPELQVGGWRSKELCAKYPGAGWMPWMAELGTDYNVMSGKEILTSLSYKDLDPIKYLNPKDIIVIQEEDNEHGNRLVEMGADPFMVTCFESPLYSPGFYDRIEEFKAKFKRQMLFSGGTDHLRFPIFEEDQIKPLVPWEDRKPLCAVVANKHYSMLPPNDSPAFQQALKDQLHDLRYNSFAHFRSNGLLDLYGYGWGDGFGISVANKVDTMRNYKFALCLENISQPGYITEKIIDCFVAGVIPIYMGAPDIDEYVPYNSYLTLKEFTDGPELMLMPEVLASGRRFLSSPEGRLHSNKGFAENMLRLISG